MSGLFTRNVAVLNIDGEHLVYRRDRTLDGNNDGIIFQNGVPVQQQIQNGQPNNDAGNCSPNLIFSRNFLLRYLNVCLISFAFCS